MEKHLTEVAWKTLAIKKQIKDVEVSKALGSYNKMGEGDAAGRVKLLDRLVVVSTNFKKESKDPEVASYLDEIIKEAKKTSAGLALLAKKGATEETSDEAPLTEPKAEDEDAEIEAYRKDYKGKLVAALAQVKARAPSPGEPPKPQLSFLVYVVGKASSVMIAPAVSSARPLLLHLAGDVGGGKYYTGECIFEKGIYTLAVTSAASGLAANVSRALRTQTGNGYKVRVRMPGGEIEDDTEPGDPVPTAADAPTFQRRLSGMTLAIQAALREQSGDAGKLRAVLEFAREKATAGNYDSAVKALDAIEKLLAEAPASTGATGKDADGFSKVKFEQVHLQWDAGKTQVQTRLKQLGGTIEGEMDDIPVDDEGAEIISDELIDEAETLAAVRNLDLILARFNEGLGDTIDALRNSESTGERATLAKKASAIADNYLAYLGSSPLVAHIDANPYAVAVDTKGTLSPLLQGLKNDLNALVA